MNATDLLQNLKAKDLDADILFCGTRVLAQMSKAMKGPALSPPKSNPATFSMLSMNYPRSRNNLALINTPDKFLPVPQALPWAALHLANG